MCEIQTFINALDKPYASLKKKMSDEVQLRLLQQ